MRVFSGNFVANALKVSRTLSDTDTASLEKLRRGPLAIRKVRSEFWILEAVMQRIYGSLEGDYLSKISLDSFRCASHAVNVSFVNVDHLYCQGD
jgi:hypothetical protein